MLHDPSRPLQREASEPAGGRAAASGIKRLILAVASEPVAHFVVLGALLFSAAQLWQAHQRTHRIVVTPAHVAEIAHKYALQFGSLPDKATLGALVKDDLHDEVLYRQGAADGLDRNDEIVRRRVVQKEGFLIQNLAAPAEPTADQLAGFYRTHVSRYRIPERATFTHIYFSDERRGGEARARAVLNALPSEMARAPERGDPFPDLYDFSAYEPEQVARLFGHTPFAQAVFKAPLGRWSGPYRSAFGWHLIRVDARAAASLSPLSAVRDRVRDDDLQDIQERANAASFDRIARRFTIVRQDQP